MFTINGNMFLGTGDLKAYGGSKHGQVLRQIERDDFHELSYDNEYSIIKLQSFFKVDGREGKILHVVAIPKGYAYDEEFEHYQDVSRESAIAMAQTKRKLIS